MSKVSITMKKWSW